LASAQQCNAIDSTVYSTVPLKALKETSYTSQKQLTGNSLDLA